MGVVQYGISIEIYINEVWTMKIAVPVCSERVSPVFDTCVSLLVVETDEQNNILFRQIYNMSPICRAARAQYLRDLGVNALICGAVSRPLYNHIAYLGIDVISCIAGDVEEVIGAYLAGRLPDPAFIMPGGFGGGRMGRGGHGGRGRPFGNQCRGRGRFFEK